MEQLIIKRKFEEKFEAGYPLIFNEALESLSAKVKDGSIMHLCQTNRKYLATAYYGPQNKGLGWVLSNNRNEEINTAFFAKKIAHAITHRAVFFEDENTNAFRVFNGEGDGIGGLTIDNYDGYYLINWYNKGIYRFRNLIFDALKKNVEVKALYEKKRFDDNGKFLEDEEFVRGTPAEFPIIVKENGVNYATYFNDGAMTGLFIDQRNVRQTLREKYVKDKTVLNTFSYTGAFSVIAALGGAKKVTSLDLAKRTIAKTNEMFEINNLSNNNHDIIIEDIFNYFKYAVRKEIKYDVVILDPPAFAKSKKNSFSASKDYSKLIEQTIDITNRGGLIVASTNCSTFDMDRFADFIDAAFQNKRRKYRTIDRYSLPADFRITHKYPEGDYLKVLFIQVD